MNNHGQKKAEDIILLINVDSTKLLSLNINFIAKCRDQYNAICNTQQHVDTSGDLP
jgi:hypothetical protein